MNMEILNVVRYNGSSGLCEITSFHVTEENRDKTVEEAGELFKSIIRNVEADIDEDDLQACLDNGCYMQENHDYEEVYLRWSDTVVEKKGNPSNPFEVRYLESGGSLCPFCESNNIGGYDVPIIEGETASQRIICNDCDKQWYNIYTLTRMIEA
jgi:hypothetical protein